jgi:pimeloyl-ACP methyl ester carboxylesterase
MTRILLFLILIEVALPLLLYLVRNRFIFFPSARPGPEVGLGYLRDAAQVELIRIRRPDGRLLAAYDVRPWEAKNGAEPVVVFAHGNAGNIAYRAPLVEEFARGTGARTVLFDYSGYGGNAGSPSEKEVCRDGLAVYDHLVAEGVPAERIVLYGESLGGAVVLEVATRRPVAGVVAQSSFSSLSSMALRVYPWLPLTSLLARGSFPNGERIRELTVPVLVVHGTRDEVIPFSEGRRLHRAAPAGTEFLAVEDAGHNDFFEVAGDEYLHDLGRRFRSWTRTAMDRTPGPP